MNLYVFIDVNVSKENHDRKKRKNVPIEKGQTVVFLFLIFVYRED